MSLKCLNDYICHASIDYIYNERYLSNKLTISTGPFSVSIESLNHSVCANTFIHMSLDHSICSHVHSYTLIQINCLYTYIHSYVHTDYAFGYINQ